MTQIPQPTKLRVISNKDLAKLKTWTNNIRRISPRIRLSTPMDKRFEGDIEIARKGADNHLPDSTIYSISDWPNILDIAFFVAIDSANPGKKPEYKPDNAFIFCFNDYAFGITYHTGEDDHADGEDTTIFSLQSYPREALIWEYITKIITSRVEELSNFVP